MIKNIPSNERPREKLFSKGVRSLSNPELISLILSTGSSQRSAIELATDILSIDRGGLGFLSRCMPEDLMDIKGMGEAKVSALLGAMELGRRASIEASIDKVNISSPRDVAKIFMEDLRYMDKEYFKILLLDTKGQIISIESISVGTLSTSVVHPREVFKVAIKKSASSIILAHNHPSGDPSPSSEDIRITGRLKEVGKLVGIDVLDHLIIGDGRFYSLKENSKM